ncbi:MAG: hypothetical protein JNJ41_19250 [Bacteroidia bacterium]|nr:hypothetical protein [Bacteroidia bacterium]
MKSYDDIIKDLQKEIFLIEEQRSIVTAPFDADIKQLKGTIEYLLNKNKPLTEAKPVQANIITYRFSSKLSLQNLVKEFIENEIKVFVTCEFVTNKLMDKYYPNKNKEEFKLQVSNLLSKWKRGKLGECNITSYQTNSSFKSTVWGRKDWLNENGEPKAGFINSDIVAA